ncbi:hypothetical protein BaRGS_00004254, partial [Batillaria attramentaria]
MQEIANKRFVREKRMTYLYDGSVQMCSFAVKRPGFPSTPHPLTLLPVRSQRLRKTESPWERTGFCHGQLVNTSGRKPGVVRCDYTSPSSLSQTTAALIDRIFYSNIRPPGDNRVLRRHASGASGFVCL